MKSFFSQLFTRLASLMPPAMAQRIRKREIIARPDLQKLAARAGASRRQRDHLRSISSGYLAKMQKVRDGKGRHTLTGIPKSFLDLDLSNP